MVVFFYPRRANTRTPAFGRAFGRTTITAHDSPCRVLPDWRQAEAWTTDRSLRDPLLHHQAASFHPRCCLPGEAEPRIPSRMSDRQPILEQMFVTDEMRTAGQPHRRLGHMSLRDGVTRDHCKQVMRGVEPLVTSDRLPQRASAERPGQLPEEDRRRTVPSTTNGPGNRSPRVYRAGPAGHQHRSTSIGVGQSVTLRRLPGHYPHIMNAVAMARQLIRIVATDPGLPRYARRKAASLEPLASSKPNLVVE